MSWLAQALALAVATTLAATPDAPLGGCPASAFAAGEAPCWNGPDGRRLPFDSFESAEEFLREALVLERHPIGEGGTRPVKLLLERNGVRAHAVLRNVDSERHAQRLNDGRLHQLLSDSYRNDLAAYALARRLGFQRVPPVVARRLDGRNGSLQLWIEDAMKEKQRRRAGLEAPDPERFEQQLQMLAVFDALVCNIDRNLGNILIDRDWQLWYIDHTRTFARYEARPYVSTGMGIQRHVWQRLAAVSDAELAEAVEPWLSRWQVADLLTRRRELVEIFRSGIASQGEHNAFF